MENKQQWFYDECEQELRHQFNATHVFYGMKEEYKGEDVFKHDVGCMKDAFDAFIFEIKHSSLESAVRSASIVACEMMRAIRDRNGGKPFIGKWKDGASK